MLIFVYLLSREFKILADKGSLYYKLLKTARVPAPKSQEHSNSSEIENSQNESHTKISELTVLKLIFIDIYSYTAGKDSLC